MVAMERPNFRQVGTRAHGAVLRGAAVRRQPPTTGTKDGTSAVSSIPSKYETVLHRDPNERNAFGNRTQRFGEDENDRPGPGAYYSPPSMIRTTADSGSVSMLGYSTGFVSKTKRFSDRTLNNVPGPGQYQPLRTETRPRNKKHGTSCFASTERAKPGSNQFVPPSNAAVPGPGEYNTSQPSASTAHNTALSAFASKSTRGFAPRAEGPAPGQYDAESSNRHANVRASQSVFKSTARRLEAAPLAAQGTPGPGAYRAEDAETALRYDWIARAHTSAVFQKGNADRFGRAPTKRAPEADLGPGSYNPPLQSSSPTAAASSAFKSATARGDAFLAQAKARAAPGPAFYHPTVDDKRSHLLNCNAKWV